MFPSINIATSLGKSVGISIGDITVNFSDREYNEGALVLSITFLPQFTLHSNCSATNTIWFHEDIVNSGIKLLKIDAVEQLGYLFTKGLPRTTFEYICKNIIGWKFLELIESILEK